MIHLLLSIVVHYKSYSSATDTFKSNPIDLNTTRGKAVVILVCNQYAMHHIHSHYHLYLLIQLLLVHHHIHPIVVHYERHWNDIVAFNSYSNDLNTTRGKAVVIMLCDQYAMHPIHSHYHLYLVIALLLAHHHLHRIVIHYERHGSTSNAFNRSSIVLSNTQGKSIVIILCKPIQNAPHPLTLSLVLGNCTIINASSPTFIRRPL